MEEQQWDFNSWPVEFVTFCQQRNINMDIYKTKPYKYIYLLEPTEEIKQEFVDADSLNWNEHFLRLPPDASIAHTRAFRVGQILPLDPSSWLAVENLSLLPGEHVLDLCCAPGAKLILISKKVCPPDEGTSYGSVTGVDISKRRLAAALKMVKRHKLPRVRLFCNDGRIFSTRVHDILTASDPDARPFKELYGTSDTPTYSSTPYRRFPGRISGKLYDKVLVDAQCTHDGSIKHVRKHVENNWKDFDPDQYSEKDLDKLYELQLDLLTNGFEQLKPGGILVYSTCSLTEEQNEAIISRFMESHSHLAQTVPPVGYNDYQINFNGQYAMRIPPSSNTGGGFFLCRIERKVI